MAINRSYIQAKEITEVTDVSILMVPVRPSLDVVESQGIPNTLLGYYDVERDYVELYIRDSTGLRVIRIL